MLDIWRIFSSVCLCFFPLWWNCAHWFLRNAGKYFLFLIVWWNGLSLFDCCFYFWGQEWFATFSMIDLLTCVLAVSISLWNRFILPWCLGNPLSVTFYLPALLEKLPNWHHAFAISVLNQILVDELFLCLLLLLWEDGQNYWIAGQPSLNICLHIFYLLVWGLVYLSHL